MSFEFTGAFGTPGITATVETVENQFWWNRYEDQVWFPAIISGAARDAGNTGYETVLRPGLLLGMITATKKLVEWSPTATDGSQRIFGILGHAQKMQRLGANQDRHFGVMVAGVVKASRILVPGQTSFGLSGQTNEFLARAQMHPRFLFDDAPLGNSFGGWKSVEAKTGNHTVTEAENNTLFTNRGASGAVNFTLPATAKKGLRYGFYGVVDQNIVVTAGTADTIVAFNDATADSVALQTSGDIIGGMFEVIGDGTGWLVMPKTFADGVLVQTITIAS